MSQRNERPPTRARGAAARLSPAAPGEPPPRRSARSFLGAAVTVGSPLAIVAAVAGLGAFVRLPGPATGLPVGLLVIVALAIGAMLVAREAALWIWFRIWLILLACTLTLLPALAIQTALARVPFTSVANGSAGPVIFASVAVIAVLLTLTGLAGTLAADTPETGALVLTPALLLVPAVLGAPGALNERAALLAVALAWSLGAVVMGVGWVLPRAAKPLVGLAALGLGFLVSWLLGQGTVTPPGRGLVVPVLTSLILIVTVICAAAAPIVALLVNRFAQTVRHQPPAASPHSPPRAAAPRGHSSPSTRRERR